MAFLPSSNGDAAASNSIWTDVPTDDPEPFETRVRSGRSKASGAIGGNLPPPPPRSASGQQAEGATPSARNRRPGRRRTGAKSGAARRDDLAVLAGSREDRPRHTARRGLGALRQRNCHAPRSLCGVAPVTRRSGKLRYRAESGLRDTDDDRRHRRRLLGCHRDVVQPRNEGQAAGFGKSTGVTRHQAEGARRF
jgi:hypothetical protein